MSHTLNTKSNQEDVSKDIADRPEDVNQVLVTVYYIIVMVFNGFSFATLLYSDTCK